MYRSYGANHFFRAGSINLWSLRLRISPNCWERGRPRPQRERSSHCFFALCTHCGRGRPRSQRLVREVEPLPSWRARWQFELNAWTMMVRSI